MLHKKKPEAGHTDQSTTSTPTAKHYTPPTEGGCHVR